MLIPFGVKSSRYSANNLRALLFAATAACETGKSRLAKTLKSRVGSIEVWHFESDHSELRGGFTKLKIQGTQGYIAAATDLAALNW